MPASQINSSPRLLVFSEGLLSASHGTGAIFSRNFSSFPRDRMAYWFLGGSGEPLLPDAVDLLPCRWPSSSFWPPTVLLAKLWNRCGLPGFWTIPVNRPALRRAAQAQAFKPDLVYAIVISRQGIDALRGVMEGLPDRVRVILQLQDFFPTGSLGFMSALRRLAPRVAEVWAVSHSILEAVSSQLPGVPQRFDPLLYLELPPQSKNHHRPYGPDFRTIALGNFWNPALLADLRAIWCETQHRLPGLQAVRWHCHPEGIERVRAAGYEPGPEVMPAPFLKGAALFDELCAADLALIPFSRDSDPASDYERFSMPSRLTELCAAGLPIFGLTGRGTPLESYISEHKIGRCAPACDAAQAAAALELLISDAAERSRLGQSARHHAETHFQLRPFQTWLVEKFSSLATHS